MKKYLIICLILLCAVEGFTSEKKMNLASTEYPPYYGSSMKNKGFIAEMINEAFKKSGYAVNIRFMPWKRGLTWTKQGKFDGLFTIWYRKERKQWFVYSDPLPANEIGFYKRRDKDIPFKTYEDLKPYRVGVIIGYANPPGFDDAGLKISAVVNNEQNMKKLFQGYIELALIDKIVGRYIINTRIPGAADALEWMEPALQKDIQYLVISKKTSDYQKKMEDFNRGLKQITDDGTVKKIMADHGFDF